MKVLDCKIDNIDDIKQYNTYLKMFCAIFEENLKNKKWILIPNKNLYFNKEIMACYPNFLNNFQNISISTSEGYERALERIQQNEEYRKHHILWDIQTQEESNKSFRNQNHPMQSDSNHRIQNCYSLIYRSGTNLYAYDNDPNCGGTISDGLLIPIFRLGSVNATTREILGFFIQNGLIPEFIDGNEEWKKNYTAVMKLYEVMEEKYDIDDSELEFTEQGSLRIKLENMDFLLDIDKHRVNLDSYDSTMVLDPNGGHWDLYEDDGEQYLKSYFYTQSGDKLYGKNPRTDIKRGGIVGIDFGTKSTVVVFQDDNNVILPMRISGTILNKEVESSDYENPTVVEFKDIESFMNQYREKEGRPYTNWEDITVSHTAFQNLINGSSKDFYSIISDLKQWAGSKKEKLLIRDRTKVEQLLEPYLNITEDDFDPIEIYAYYIGSYINNMRNGIYLEYFLSFPVTYEREIREKILSSFTKGIKKSLPNVILQDESIMKKFKVRHGANEPAAYAICALDEYGFEPEDNEKIYYGVFDFGGGTLDFDFGIFRESEDERYDYDLEHFGSGGDRYLGGENILKELAFETFKKNIDTLRQKGITFYRPEWCERFIGDETLVDNNGTSKLNMKLLMEKLRGIWEQTEQLENRIKINLFSKNGEMLTGEELVVEIEELNKVIWDKIDGGIKNFFIAMEKAFENEDCDKIYILLAGNSCKHPIVKIIFQEYIDKYDKNIEVLPALGTDEAYEKLEQLEIACDRNNKAKPTGKTGVAYGLLKSTADSCIKIINRDEEAHNEINFKYYVGVEKKKKLNVILNPNTEYNTFKFFSYVKSDVFNLYYTTLPEALGGKLEIQNIKRIRVSLENEYDSDTKIFVRAIGADKIEYAVTVKDVIEKEYLETGILILE